MTKTLILHIGTEKTGSTSLQRILHQNRELLANHGILVPVSFGKYNHGPLVAALMEDDVFETIKIKTLKKTNGDINQLRQNIRQSFLEDLKKHPNTNKIIFTSELIHSRMFLHSDISRIAEFFSGIVDDVKVIMFLRRQDRLAVSRFSTVLKDGYTEFNNTFADLGARSYINTPASKIPNDILHYYDYKNLLQRFIPQYGKNSMIPIIYRDGSSDVPTEFLKAAGIPENLIESSHNELILNQAMSAEAQFLVCEVNKLLKQSGHSTFPNPKVRKLYTRISRDHQGKKRMYGKAETQQFFQKFNNSNEWVRENFFPESPSLFESDFSEYYDKVDYKHLESELLDTAYNYFCDITKTRKNRNIFEYLAKLPKNIFRNYKND